MEQERNHHPQRTLQFRLAVLQLANTIKTGGNGQSVSRQGSIRENYKFAILFFNVQLSAPWGTLRSWCEFGVGGTNSPLRAG